ncbi:Rho termination factor N-terminal domain-containing protein [uncultured Ilyobacter sp.]|uniref:Rho termination factor N-terminal domain-containing protein n=1 Tax=uncultured Ilyobacter sp. TaxID=544433 RepID=UPI0029C7353F|nr:Rho termination factor N-terminal domain-containing protein [uncultured Ilyobacter sp.]
MKCPICGKEFSDKVYRIHIKSCKKNEKEVLNEFTEETLKEKTVAELKEICKSKGITGYSRLKEDELISIILGGE